MKYSAAVATILIFLVGVAMMTGSAQTTVYEPSPTDPRVVAGTLRRAMTRPSACSMRNLRDEAASQKRPALTE